MRIIKDFSVDLIKSRSLVWELTVRDYRQQNQGSFLGVVWSYFQPLLFFGLLYVIFTFGLKAGSTVDMPFGLYLVSGLICWQFFANNLTAITGVVKSHAYLVKKVDFRLSILPLVKIMSSTTPHVFLIAIAILLAAYQGYWPTLYTLQIFYYYAACVLLLLAVGWITSSTSIFVKDVNNLVALVVQFGFWLTPIFWNLKTIPEKYHWIVNLNPMTYLVTGYRDSITSSAYFWDKPVETIVFWSTVSVLMLVGVLVFKRLKPHFAEVL